MFRKADRVRRKVRRANTEVAKVFQQARRDMVQAADKARTCEQCGGYVEHPKPSLHVGRWTFCSYECLQRRADEYVEPEWRAW